MRVRLPLGRTVFFLAAFAFALVALIPLRLAISWFGAEGLAAREAEGSIWLGVLKEAQLGPVALGDVRARLNVLPLLLGRARLSLHRDETGGGPFDGAVTVTRHGFGFGDMTGRLPTSSLFAPVPITALDLDGASAHFADGQCDSASGRVQATIVGQLAGVPLPGTLAGELRCAEGALLVPLASQSGLGQLDLSLRADGSYRLYVLVRQVDPSLAPRLGAAGFLPQGDGFSRRIDGHF